MGFIYGGSPRHPVLAKVIGCLVTLVMAVLSYQSKDMPLTAAMVVVALGFAYEACVMGLQHRAVRILERVPFFVIVIILMIASAIVKSKGNL